MLELPEAVVIAGQMNMTLQGKQIDQVVANQTPHKFAWYSGDPANYPSLLTGKIISSATAYGGIVECAVDGLVLSLSTSLRYLGREEKRPPKHQLLLTFTDGSAFVCSVQMWGGLFCYPAGEKGGFIDTQIARERPSPLSDAFTRTYFDSLFDENTPKLPAKAFLATEQRIPGLGNGVLQDILWTARIHPKRKLATLTNGEVTGMYAAVKSVLREMTDCGGRDTEKDLFGNPGGYQTVLSKNTVGTPCPVCRESIRKEAYMGGSIYYCPGCQQQ